MATEIQSKEYRRLARENCYRYGCLYIYSDNYVSLDEHTFPSYQSRESTGAVEKFLTLMQGLGALATGNDTADKRSKPLTGVQWSGDNLDLSISLNGMMYFRDYRDYMVSKKRLRTELLEQGWEINNSSSEKLGVAVTSYRPARFGTDALYADDPVDAAGMAMMTSAMQHVTAQGKVLVGYTSGNKQMYAEGSARIESTVAGATSGIPLIGQVTGIASNLSAGMNAFASNMNSGLVGKWAHAGHPVELLIGGQPVRQSVNGVLTSARFKELAYAVDDTSGGNVYPTQMEVDITVKNMYGSLLTTSKLRE